MRWRRSDAGQATIELIALLPLLGLLGAICLQAAVAGQAWWLTRAAAQQAARAAAIGGDPRSAAMTRLPAAAQRDARVAMRGDGVVVRIRVPSLLGADLGTLSAHAQMRSQR